MLALLQLLILLGAFFTLGYIQAKKMVTTVTIGVILLIFTLIWRELPWWLLLPVWLIYGGVAFLFNYEPWRLRYLSEPMMLLVRKMLPALSSTEREALEAGDVWWEGEVFRGNPDWNKLLSMPQPKLADEEQAFMDNQVEKLCGMLDDWDITQFKKDIPKKAWDYIKKEKFWGIIIDKHYGGLGFSALAHSKIISKVATANVGAAVTLMVPNSLGPAELLMHYGTEEQKNYYLPRLAAGEEIPCFGLTGTDSGSDAAAMLDHGVVCEGEHEGKKVLGIRLNWDKRYITLAPVATLLGLAFKLSDPDHLLGKNTDLGITLALIPTNTKGVEHGKRHWPINPSFMNGPIRGKEVFIPIDWVIGGRERVGDGWRMLMECLGIGRAISLPALGTSTLKHCTRLTSAYTRVREQFKVPIAYFEGVQELLGSLGAMAYLAEAARTFTTIPVDAKLKPAIASAILKYHLSELSRKGINDAMDIHGGRGIQLGPHNYIVPGWLGIPISITVEGANILTRNLIIFGQGALRCHPYLRKEMDAANEQDHTQALKMFDSLINQHMGYIFSNASRAFLLAVTRSKLAKAPVGGPLAPYYQHLTRMSSALAIVTDVTLGLFGGALKRKESLSARLGDILSYLYLGSAILKYHHENHADQEEAVFAKWGLDYCLYQIQSAFAGLFSNYPSRWVSAFLRGITFPLGYHYRKPSDKLNTEVVKLLISPSGIRERLTGDSYLGNPAVASVENAFKACMEIQPLLKKFNEAIKNKQVIEGIPVVEQIQSAKTQKIISAEEAKQLLHYEELRQEAIRVDEFEPGDMRA